MKGDDLEKELLELLGGQTGDTQPDDVLSKMLEGVEIGLIDQGRPSLDKKARLDSATLIDQKDVELAAQDSLSDPTVQTKLDEPFGVSMTQSVWSATLSDNEQGLELEEGVVAGDSEEELFAAHDGGDTLTPSIPDEKKSRSIIARLRSLYDSKNWPDSIMGSSDPWPKKVYMGFLQNVRKKDLISYIDEWVVDNNCNRSSCSYQVRSWGNGWAFEIHEGGPGQGALNSVLRALEEGREVVVPSSDRFLKVVKRMEGFSSYFLNEFEAHEPSSEAEFKDSMTPLYKRHHGLMMAGVLSAVLCLGIMMASWTMVYVVYGKDKSPVYSPINYELPSQQIGKISDIANRYDAYLRSLTFISGNWKLNLEQVTPPEIHDLSDPIEGQLPVLHHENAELTRLRHELNNMLSQETP